MAIIFQSKLVALKGFMRIKRKADEDEDKPVMYVKINSYMYYT